ncbi:hypothetical protein pipiens_017325 [Culex pipiens pipiens]|uniref:Uncharacterized protein n=1 Tax=Culex pipiens pipiens TaxID=38569 RepID=A0ABD1CH97_CULPP
MADNIKQVKERPSTDSRFSKDERAVSVRVEKGQWHHLYGHFGLQFDVKQKKFQLTLVEAGRQQLEPIEIHSKAEEEYAVMYSAVLIDLCEGCEALDLEKQTIKKIRSEMLIASMTKVNLLSKLKDRVDIDPALPAK